MLQDLRHGIRMLTKTPLLTAVAVAVLSLGLGANTAVFSYVNGLFLRPLQHPAPQQLVRLYAAGQDGSGFETFSYPNYLDLRDRVASFEGLAAHQQITVSLGAGDYAEDIPGEIVTGNYFQLLGVRPALGRAILPEDDPGLEPVAVISDSLWRDRFRADPEVLGSRIPINGHPFTIVGVAPPEFRGTFEAFPNHFWVPMWTHDKVRPRGLSIDRRGWGWLHGTARLVDGATIAAARQDLNRVCAQMTEEHPRINRGLAMALYPAAALPEQYQQGVSMFLLFFAAAATIVVLITCANLSGLFLARVVARRREIAVRKSLGASRGILLRQWVLESMLLSALGGVAGVALAMWIKDALLRLAPPDWSNFAPSVVLDGRVLAFAALATLATGLLFGLMPAIRASGFDVAESLKEESGGSVVAGSRLFGFSVLTQVALSLVLLVVAGLFLRTIAEADAFAPGFDSERLAVATVSLQRHGYSAADGNAYYQRVLERLRAAPGVEHASTGLVVPLGMARESMGFEFPGHVNEDGTTAVSLAYNVVGSDYFETMGIPMVHGRSFEERDAQEGATPTAILNETAAQRFFPDGDAVGRQIQVAGGPSLQVIGVARDIKYYSLGEAPRSFVYGPSSQFYMGFATFHVRTAGDPAGMLPVLRQAIAAGDPGVAASQVMTLGQLRRVPLFPQLALSRVATLFSVLALALTALGIYGVVSYSVTRRTRELGVRMALGASSSDIIRTVLGRTMRIAAIGLLLGLGAAAVAGRLFSGLLFGVTPLDGTTFLGMSLLLAAVAGTACYLPARRAARLDPVAALRYE